MCRCILRTIHISDITVSGFVFVRTVIKSYRKADIANNRKINSSRTVYATEMKLRPIILTHIGYLNLIKERVVRRSVSTYNPCCLAAELLKTVAKPGVKL